MDNLAPHLIEDYKRVIQNIPIESLHYKRNEGVENLSVNDVLKAHYYICDHFETENGTTSLFGVKNLNLLLSAIDRQYTSYSGVIKWKNKFEIFASVFFGLVKNHSFHDGNKRTSILSLIFQLTANRKYLTCSQKDLEKLTLNVAESNYENYKFREKYKNEPDEIILVIADFLRRNTRSMEKDYHAMTYAEFNAKLKPYGFYLDNINGGFISVCKKEKHGIFGRKERTVNLLQIGFPGWKRQMGMKAIKETLKVCDLTAERGVDSKTFYAGNEPIYKLIEEYSPLLDRLKNK